MSFPRYYVNDAECDAATFRDATNHLEYKHAQHCYRQRGELYNFADDSTIELENKTETNQHGHKRDVRAWSFNTKK